MPLSPGQVLKSRYRIVKLLGQGGFGAVYRAWDVNLNRPCALKENLETSQEAQHQFKREAHLLSQLNHPSLPRVIDHFFIPDQGQYLVMDFVEGEDLQVKLDRRGPLSETQVLPWISQVCQALAYLHSQNPPIVHRDLKPANIRITPDGKAMLVDFGIAKIFDPSLKTTVGARAITPGYSPPEQYGQGTTDTRSDIYALGATLYTLLTGQMPPESVSRIAHEPLIAPRQIKPEISLATETAILTAMELGPETRFQSASEFQEAITHPAGAHETTIQISSASNPQATVATPGSKPITPVSSKRNRSSWIGMGVAVALVVGCLFFFIMFQWYRSQSSTPSSTRPTRAPTLEGQGVFPTPGPTKALAPTPRTSASQFPDDPASQTASPATRITPAGENLAPPSATPSPLPTSTSWPTNTIEPTPAIFGFQACSKPCNQSNTSVTRNYPEGAKAIYFQWRYENIPANAHYVRTWSMDGQEWVRYDCTWPYLSEGVVTGSLTEPDGLHSGTWQVEIYINGQLLLREQVYVAGNWTFWQPAGIFYTCTGKI